MNFPTCCILVYIFCVWSPIPTINGIPIEEAEEPTTWDEAQAAANVLELRIQNLRLQGIFFIKEFSDSLPVIIWNATRDSAQIGKEFVTKIRTLEANLTDQGYNVSGCIDEFPFVTEPDFTILQIETCSYGILAETWNIYLQAITVMDSSLGEATGISATLYSCGTAQECIDKAMSDITAATVDLPNKMSAALGEANAASDKLTDSFNICVGNKLDELTGREDLAFEEVFSCVKNILDTVTPMTLEPTSTVASLDSSTVPSTTTKTSGASAVVAHLVLLPIFLVILVNFFE